MDQLWFSIPETNSSFWQWIDVKRDYIEIMKDCLREILGDALNFLINLVYHVIV